MSQQQQDSQALDLEKRIRLATLEPMLSSDYPLRDDEIRRFRIDSKETWNDHLPAQRVSMRRQFISLYTDHEAKPMSQRDWNIFNHSLNKNLDMGLSDKQVRMLSRMDQALAEVPRFVKVRAMPYTKMDSTAAHSKQVMNNVQYMFEKASGGKALSAEQNQLRRDALLGAWVHDMGEIVMELTTASDMFAIKDPKEKAAVKASKDVLEDGIFALACELSLKEEESGPPGLLLREVWKLRQLALAPQGQAAGVTLTSTDAVSVVKARMERLQHGIDDVRTRLSLPKEGEPARAEVQQLIGIYNRTEIAAKPGEKNFLNMFVKTVESVEGQRYFQRKTAETSTSRLTEMLDPEAVVHVPYEQMGDYETLQACRRCETRLPQMFAQAGNDFEGRLAAATASYTYRSLARQFLPKDYDHVALASEIIDRQPQPDYEKPEFKGKTPTRQELQSIRERELGYKREQWEKQPKGSPDVRYYTREQMGVLYRAAEKASARISNGFVPQTACLGEYGIDPEGKLTNPVPKALQEDMRKISRDLQAGDRHNGAVR